MTLFTMLLVIIAERLFKLGEHWHLDHRLEVLFRRIRHFSMLRTLLMMAGVMVITFLLLRALYGLFFNVPLLVVWILLGVLCIGAGKVRLHYHAYLKAASRDDAHARNAMASELTMIHGVPPDCDEREFLRELQNALLWINFRYYLAPLFWFVVGGPWGPVLLMGYAFLRAWQTWLARYLTPHERLLSGIDAILQREADEVGGEGSLQTDVILLTHDCTEAAMNAALAQMQALPTVLQPIVRIRKEELN